MHKHVILTLLLPIPILGMERTKSLFSLDEDPRETHYAFEEPLYKQAGHLAWERIKGNEKPLEATGIAVGVALYKNMKATPHYINVGTTVSTDRIAQDAFANAFDADLAERSSISLLGNNGVSIPLTGSNSLEAGRRSMEVLQTSLEPERVNSFTTILQHPPSNVVVAGVILAGAATGFVAHETWEFGCDVTNAYKAKQHLTKEKEKAIDAYLAHKEEKERKLREEQERAACEEKRRREEQEREEQERERKSHERSSFGNFLGRFGL